MRRTTARAPICCGSASAAVLGNHTAWLGIESPQRFLLYGYHQQKQSILLTAQIQTPTPPPLGLQRTSNNATQARLPNLPQRLHRAPDPEALPVNSLLQTDRNLLLLLLLLLGVLIIPEPERAGGAPEPMAALPQHHAAAREAD